MTKPIQLKQDLRDRSRLVVVKHEGGNLTMADDTRKLKNIQLPTEPSDGFAASVVKANADTGGAILDGGIPSGRRTILARHLPERYSKVAIKE